MVNCDCNLFWRARKIRKAVFGKENLKKISQLELDILDGKNVNIYAEEFLERLEKSENPCKEYDLWIEDLHKFCDPKSQLFLTWLINLEKELSLPREIILLESNLYY